MISIFLIQVIYFTGKCRHCHTRPKYLRAQSSFDSGSAGRRSATVNALVSAGSSSSTGGTSLSTNTYSGNSSSATTSATLTLTGSNRTRDCRVCEADPSPGAGSYGRRRSRSVDRYDVWQLASGKHLVLQIFC